MKDKHFVIIISAIFLAFFISSPIIAGLSKAGILHSLDTKNLFVPEREFEDTVPGAAVLNAIERGKADIRNIYTNCIPFYNQIVSAVQSTELVMLNLVTNTMDSILYGQEDEIPVSADTSTSDDSANSGVETEPPKPEIKYRANLIAGNGRPNFYTIEPAKVMERVEGASEKELQRRLEIQLNYIQKIKDSAPELNYYVYMGTRMQDTEIFSEIFKGALSTKCYFDYFVDHLDPEISFDYLRFDTVEDRVEKKFRSDHHWNIHGVYEGYQQIINMMYERTPEIGKPYEYDIIEVPGIKWCGSIGGTVGMTDEDYFDNFEILDYSNMPDYSGNAYDVKKMQEKFLNGEYNNAGTYADYYGMFHQPQSKFTFRTNATGRNLLILGDSYSWAASVLIASHFDTTICYNQPWTTGNNKIDYHEIIDKYDITDVLILQYSSRLMFGYDDCDFDNLILD